MTEALSSEQAEVVAILDRPVLVQAGPGSGKTRTLVEKFVRLTSQGTPPERVLALTFSKKAALEMQRRIQAATRRSSGRLWISTFHSFGHTLIQRFPVESGIPRTFRLLTGFKEWVLVRDVLRDTPLNGPLAAARAHRGLIGEVANAISVLKQNLVGPDELAAAIRDSPKASVLPDLLAVYCAYEREIRARRHIDYRDLIVVAKRLVETKLEIRERVQNWFDAVILDEIQDVDRAQLGLLQALLHGCPLAQRITACGDLNQSIYRFRGAVPEAILTKFLAHFDGAIEKRLSRNFRSVHPVVQLGQRALRETPAPEAPSAEGSGPTIEVRAAESGLSEATAIAREVRRLARSPRRRGDGTYLWRDIAILCRSVRRDGKVIEGELERLGVPYRVHGNASFYRNPAVAFLVNYILALVDEADDAPLRRVLASPVPGLPEVPIARFLNRVSSRGRHAGRYFWFLRFLLERENKDRWPIYRPDRADEAEASQELKAAGDDYAQVRPPYFYVLMTPDEKQAFYDFHQCYLFLRARARRAKDALPALVSAIATRSGLIDWILRLERDEPRTAARHASNVKKLHAMVEDYTEIAAADRRSTAPPVLGDLAAHLRELIEHFANESEVDPPADELDEREDAVSVMTVHQAKGLEFDVVFVPHLVTGKFPVPPRPPVVLTRAASDALGRVSPGFRDSVCLDMDTHAQDERRLFYVAVTRARERVFLSWAKRYDGDEEESAPSPFLVEAIGGTELDLWRTLQESSDAPATVLGRIAQECQAPHIRFRNNEAESEQVEGAATKDELEVVVRRLYWRGDDTVRRGIENVLSQATPAGLDSKFVLAPDPFPRESGVPLQLASAPVELSASRLSEHRECPRKFFYSKLLHIERSSDAQAQFGTAVHAVLEEFHKSHPDLRVLSDPQVRDALVSELRGGLGAAISAARETFTTTFEYQRYLASARGMAEPYVAMLSQEPLPHVAGRELDIHFAAGGARLVAKIDRVCADAPVLADARQILIADYKTVREATTRALTLKKRIQDGAEIQLVTYFQAFKSEFGVTPSLLGKIYLRHRSEWRPGTLEVLLKVQDAAPPKGADFNGRSGRLQTDRAWISEAELDAAWSLIVDQIRSILRPDLTRFVITPSLSACRYCTYSTVCGKEEGPDAADG